MRDALGKGLNSLIPQRKEQAAQPKMARPSRVGIPSKKESVFNIEVDKIRPNPHQPRKDMDKDALIELADSIKEHGILQPLILTKVEKATSRGRKVEYEIVAGERRWRAAQIAHLPHVPAIIKSSAADTDKLQIALVENVQRENLNPIDIALAYKQLEAEFGLTHEEIAEKVGRARPTISNSMRLLALPDRVQQGVINGVVTEGHARALFLARPKARNKVYDRIVVNSLNVRQAEELARKYKNEKLVLGHQGPKNPLFRKYENELVQRLGRRVSITKRGKVGAMRIEFSNNEELGTLVSHLKTYQ